MVCYNASLVSSTTKFDIKKRTIDAKFFRLHKIGNRKKELTLKYR